MARWPDRWTVGLLEHRAYINSKSFSKQHSCIHSLGIWGENWRRTNQAVMNVPLSAVRVGSRQLFLRIFQKHFCWKWWILLPAFRGCRPKLASWLVGWYSLTSLFSTNTAISETKTGQYLAFTSQCRAQWSYYDILNHEPNVVRCSVKLFLIGCVVSCKVKMLLIVVSRI